MILSVRRAAKKIQNGFFVFYMVLMLLTLYFAVNAQNLSLRSDAGDLLIGTGTTWVSVVFLGGMVVLGLYYLVNTRFQSWIDRIFVQHGVITGSVFLAMAVAWQIILILNTHPAIGFDPGAIHEALLRPKNNPNLQSYYSYNTNNLPLALIQHQIAVMIKSTSWLTFDLLNFCLVLFTVAIDLIIIRLIAKDRIAIALYTHAIWLFIFPMTLVPYSDVAVLPFVALLLLCYVIVFQQSKVNICSISASVVGGFVVCGIYLLKPSAILPIVAIGIIELLNLFLHASQRLKTALGMLALVSTFAVSAAWGYNMASHKIAKQTYMIIQPHRTLPPIHFISMGVSGDGGYNPDDALAMVKQPSQQAMAKYSEDKLVERLRQKGFFGYLAFLLHKQDKNTSDGTFTWLKEGHFMTATPVKTGGIKGLIQNIFYPGGHYLSDFHFIAQIFWVLCLGIITLGWRVRDRMTDVLRLGIVGGFCYLLIFEGGRSRYIIQFLPLFILLTIIVFPSVVSMLKEKLSWLKSD